jgi:MFS family permease
MMSSTVAPAPTRPARSGLSRGLLFLSAALTAGYGVLFTIVGDYRDAYGLSETMLGFVIGIGFIVSFISQTLLGPFGDRGHARKLIVFGAAFNVVGLLMMGFGTTATVILTGRIIGGLGIGAAGPAIRRIVVVASGDDVGKNLGTLFSADVFGFAVGPVISAFLVGPFGIAAPFIVIAAATLGSLMWVWFTVDITEESEATENRLAFGLLRDRIFAGAVLFGMAAYAMIGAFDALWDVVHTDLDTPEWMANLGIALFAVPLVVLGPTSGKLAQRHGPFLVATAGMVAAALFLGAYGLIGVGALIFAVAMVHALTDGLSFAASGVAVGMIVPKERMSGAQGVLGGMQSLAAGITAPIIGWVYENHSQRAAYWLGAGLVLTFATLGLILAAPQARTLRD